MNDCSETSDRIQNLGEKREIPEKVEISVRIPNGDGGCPGRAPATTDP